MKQKKHFMKGQGSGNPYGSPYLLSGLLICEACGDKFVGYCQIKNHRKYSYYLGSTEKVFSVAN